MPSADPRPARYLKVRADLLTRTAGALTAAAARPPRRSVLRDTLPAGPPSPSGRTYRSAAARRAARRAHRRAIVDRLVLLATGVALVTAGGLLALALALSVLALALAGFGWLAGLLFLAGVLVGVAVIR